MEILKWVQEWYEQQCDGDWEHAYGIKIETLDNPGWKIEIDLVDTSLHGYEVEYKLFEKSDDDWYGIKIENNVFNAAGDCNKLDFLLEKFKELVTLKMLEQGKDINQ